LCVLLEYILCKSVIYVRIVLVGFKRVVVILTTADQYGQNPAYCSVELW